MSESPPTGHPIFFPKVTAYVTTERAGVPHLLLFRHPLAGTQLPAGSIEEGEDPLAAARREVAEETGLLNVTDPVSLGATTTHLGPGARILLRTEVPRLDPDLDSAPSSTMLNRGLTVELVEVTATRARVRSDVLDYEHSPPVIVSRREGWVDAAALGSTVVRHHIHVRHEARIPGPDRWTQVADGHELAPFWVPMIPRPAVCAGQREWLDFAYNQLLHRASR